MRLFIAVDIPEKVKDELISYQKYLKTNGFHARWVSKENIHLTLAFLGEVDEKNIDVYVDIMTATISNFDKFTIAVGSPGCFSSRGDARVIWAGLAGNIDVLKTLQAGLSMGLKRHGYVEDKHFQAHLTLGREGMNLPLYKELSSAWKWNSDMRFEVRNIILFSSELRSGGPIYSEVAAVNLK